MRGSRIFRTITLRTMLQNRTRTIVTIIGVILSTAMITAVTTFGSSLMGFFVDYAKEMDGNWHMAVWDLPQEDNANTAKSVLTRDSIEAAAAVQNLGFAKWENGMAGGNEWGYLCVKSLPARNQDMIPIQLESGRLPENDSEILLPWFLPANEPEYNQTEIGDTIELEIGTLFLGGEQVRANTQVTLYEPGEEVLRDAQKKKFTVTGYYETGYYHSESGIAFEVFCGPGPEQETADLYLRLNRPAKTYAAADKLAAQGYDIQVNNSLLRWLGVFDNDNASRVIIGLFSVIIGIIMVGAISLIYNAFSISVRERTTQFGLLSSVGATKKQLRRALFYEAVFVSVIGIPVGVICGIIGIGITLRYISFGITAMIHGVQRQIALRVSFSVLILTVLLAVVTIAVSVWVPSGRIRRISPMEAIRASRDIRILPHQVKTGRGILRLFGVPGMLAQKNYKRDRKKYRSTVFSLTMSIVLFVSSVTISNALTDTGGLVLEAPDVEIKLVLYEDALDDSDQEVRELLEFVTEHQETDQVYYYREFDQYLEADPEMLSEGALLSAENVGNKMVLGAQCIFVPDERFAQLLKESGAKTDTYWENGEAKALLFDYRKNFNSETQRYEKAQIFTDEFPDTCAVGSLSSETPDDERMGEDWLSQLSFTENFKVNLVARTDRIPEGIIDSYLSHPFVILPMSVLNDLGKDVTALTPHCLTVKARDYRAVYENLDKELKARGLSDTGGVNLVNLMESYEQDRNFLVAVNVLCFGFTTLISLIALANVFNTISTNLLLRRREFAMLRSMGLSPKGSRRMLLLESLSYSIRAVLYGGVLSAGIAVLTWEIIRIGADSTFHLPWKPLLAAALMVWLMVAGTMVLTMRKINKAVICEELKMI